MNNQEAKKDAGKPKLSLVPRQIIFDIAEVREYGNQKYHDPDNWKTVEKERYRDAAFRHFMKYLDDPDGVDEESGIEHLKHLACNIAFLCELEKDEEKKESVTLGVMNRCPRCGNYFIRYDLNHPESIDCNNPVCKFNVEVDENMAKAFLGVMDRSDLYHLVIAWWNYKTSYYAPFKDSDEYSCGCFD